MRPRPGSVEYQVSSARLRTACARQFTVSAAYLTPSVRRSLSARRFQQSATNPSPSAAFPPNAKLIRASARFPPFARVAPSARLTLAQPGVSALFRATVDTRRAECTHHAPGAHAERSAAFVLSLLNPYSIRRSMKTPTRLPDWLLLRNNWSRPWQMSRLRRLRSTIACYHRLSRKPRIWRRACKELSTLWRPAKRTCKKSEAKKK